MVYLIENKNIHLFSLMTIRSWCQMIPQRTSSVASPLLEPGSARQPERVVVSEGFRLSSRHQTKWRCTWTLSEPPYAASENLKPLETDGGTGCGAGLSPPPG